MKLQLGKKIVLTLVVFAVILCGVSILVSYRVIENMNDGQYMDEANEKAATVARVVDVDDAVKLKEDVLEIYKSLDERVMSDEWGSPEFEAYQAHYADLEKTPAFRELLEQLRNLQEVNNVNCFYLAFVDPDDETFVYMVDAAEEDPCPIGCIDPLYDFNKQVLDDPSRGFPAYITNTEEYGWLVTSGAPVYDKDGKVVCYALTDISMDMIKAQQTNYILGLSVGLVILTIVLSLIVGFFIRRNLTRPLNTLSKAASQYCAPEEGKHSTFVGLDIHTGDEIEDLHTSMVQMEHDIDTYIHNLVETRAELSDSRIQASIMSDLARKDALTGIRNKFAYDQEVELLEASRQQGLEEFGIAVVDMNDLKVINDTYGHERGNASITQLSRLICTTFAHSPVFRIGGDEFVVVLKNADYEKAEELIAEFRSAVEAQSEGGSAKRAPWESISAAIGYALYDPKIDSDVTSVFRRADKDMYTQKRLMKGQAAR